MPAKKSTSAKKPKSKSSRAFQSQRDKRLGECVIDRWSHDGRGIAQLNGKTTFVAGALVGERVTARLVAEHPRYIEARVDEVITVSTERVTPPCEFFSACGGCQLQHIHTDTQRELKQQGLLQQLKSWGGVEPKRLLSMISAQENAYRNRARLGVWYNADGSVSVGFRELNSKTISPISSCYVLATELSNLIFPLQNWLVTIASTRAVTHIELIKGDKELAIILRHTNVINSDNLLALENIIKDHTKEIVCHIWLEPNGNLGLTDLSGKVCDPRLYYSFPDLSFAGLTLGFHPQDFIQVNGLINAKMVAQTLNLLALKSTDVVLDLFCGMGNFSLPLAQHCAQVIGIEGSSDMVARASENADRLHITNAEFFAANLSEMTHTQLLRLMTDTLNLTNPTIDAMLLDPPRDGAKEIITAILQADLPKQQGGKGQLSKRQLGPQRIVYVSCNPATLARDSALLIAAGYELDSLGAIDMFPHTSHLESIALFLLK
jgi:23S rRNA (uracil1939-C5)-methyltransferase